MSWEKYLLLLVLIETNIFACTKHKVRRRDFIMRRGGGLDLKNFLRSFHSQHVCTVATSNKSC